MTNAPVIQISDLAANGSSNALDVTVDAATVARHSANLADDAGTTIFKAVVAAALARFAFRKEGLSADKANETLKAAWKDDSSTGKRSMMYNWLKASDELSQELWTDHHAVVDGIYRGKAA